MAEKFLSGNTGLCVIGASNAHNPHFNTWSATFTREQHDVTAFGDSGRRRIPGIADVSGSAGGFMTYDAGNAAPNVFANAHDGPLNPGSSDTHSHPIVLTLQTGCSYTFNGVVSDVAISSTMAGDATITMNFQLASGLEFQGTSGTTAMEAWDES